MTATAEISREDAEATKPQLPDGWRWAKLGEVCNIVAGQSPPSETYRKSPEGLPFFQGKADFGPRHPVARTWCVSPNKIALAGDILISVRAPVGPTNVADVECCIGRGLAAIRPGKDADRDFVLSALRLYEPDLAKLGSGSTFHAIDRQDVETFTIPFPPLAEQKRIAGILREQMAAVERARASAEAQLQAAENLPAAYLRAVFDNDESKSWARKPLGIFLTEVRNGIYKSEGYYGHGTPMIRMFNIGRLDGKWILQKLDAVETTDEELQMYQVKQGDVVVNRVNSRELVGKCAVVDETTAGFVYESKNMRLRLRTDYLLPDFFALWMNSISGRQQVQDRLKQIVGQATINRSDLDSLEIPVPPLADQRRIAAQLSSQMASAERLRQTLADQLDAINKLPAALLRRAFNGEL